MIRTGLIIAASLLAACGDGQPFEFPVDEEEATEEDPAEEGGFGGDGAPPPGTQGPEAEPDELLARS